MNNKKLFLLEQTEKLEKKYNVSYYNTVGAFKYK